MKRWGGNRNGILALAVVLGLIAHQPAQWLENTVLPLLGLVITLSALNIRGEIFRSPKTLFRDTLWGIGMSYLVHSSVILGLSFLLIESPEIRKGFILIAAVPPAVAVIPFSDILGGDKAFSLIATTGCYLSALVIMPLIMLRLLGPGFFDPMKLLSVVMLLIVIPLLVSRSLLAAGMDKRIEPIRGVVINWCFFVIIYTIIGVNKDLLLRNPLSLIPSAIIAAAGTFLVGTVIGWMLKGFRIDSGFSTSLIMLATQKNSGLAGGIALTLFDARSALPAAVCTVFMISYFIWMNACKR